MKVNLAGYNVDADLIKDKDFTPETISAAYARISRDPSSIEELRKRARNDVEKARLSNKNIVFDYGHRSIAEHAVLNFDITGLSRLAIEALEHSRLCSYTEKSQRYQKLEDDFTIPQEIIDIKLKDDFINLIRFQNDSYRQAFKVLSKYLKASYPDMLFIKRVNKAKEDARYLTSLAMHGQIGMTINAHSLEVMIQRLASHPLQEVKDLAENIYNAAIDKIPSLLRYVEKDNFREKTRINMSEISKDIISETEKNDFVNLVSINGTELVVASSLLFENGHSNLYQSIFPLSAKVAKNIFDKVFLNMDKHSATPRAFELMSFLFEITTSAACFAQIKRHRMSTILAQPYDSLIPPVIPDTFKEIGLDVLFNEVIDKSNYLFDKIVKKSPESSFYSLTQSHCRRSLVSMNVRQLYNFARLRMDKHSQWEIRRVANEMIGLAKGQTSNIMKLACGKHEFEDVKKDFLKKMST